MTVTFPHSFATARHVPVFGFPAVHVATSCFDVKITGSSFVPTQSILASRVTASDPPTSLATTVPAWIVNVAPGRM